ncbi:hypothetical protein [Succinimonas amylolytica]|uniref:hypothetical protein n=1 Tax=Succinimonas amylolytica TaxID=83769 RepID=UPI000382E886|nr:hypothetical protein [Succinimonas amylolytica]
MKVTAESGFVRTENWEHDKPLNLDLSGYIRPMARKGLLVFSWFYLGAAALFVFFIVFRNIAVIFQRYVVLMEAAAAVLLFLAGKCWFAYARNSSRFLRWELTPGRILSISEDAQGHSFLEMEFCPSGVSSDRVVFTEEYNCPLIDEIRKTGLNALPVLYQPSRADRGAYYVDLRFRNDGLNRDNLIRLESAESGVPE